MNCHMCQCEATLYDDGRARALCAHCFRDVTDREPTDAEKVVLEVKKRHYCGTCDWVKTRDISLEGGRYNAICYIRPEGKQVNTERDFCGEHPEAIKERTAAMKVHPGLDATAVLSVAVGQFLGSYFSKTRDEPLPEPEGEEDLPEEEVESLEETKQRFAKAIVDDIITDMHLNMEDIFNAWTDMDMEKQKETHRRWTERVMNKL